MIAKKMYLSSCKLFALAIFAHWQMFADAHIFKEFEDSRENLNPHLDRVRRDRYESYYPRESYSRVEELEPPSSDDGSSEMQYHMKSAQRREYFSGQNSGRYGWKYPSASFLPYVISSPIGTLWSVKYGKSVGITNGTFTWYKRSVGVGNKYSPLLVMAKPLVPHYNSSISFLIADLSLRKYFRERSGSVASEYPPVIPSLVPVDNTVKAVLPQPGFTGFSIVENPTPRHSNAFLLRISDSSSYVKASQLNGSLKLVTRKECYDDIDACLFIWESSKKIFPL